MSAHRLVASLLETDDLDWEPEEGDPDLKAAASSAAKDIAELESKEWQIGFEIHTGTDDYVEGNMIERGYVVNDAAWAVLRNDVFRLEMNAMDLLCSNGIAIRGEAHGDNSFYGSAWVGYNNPRGLDIVHEFHDRGEPYSMGSGTINELKGAGHLFDRLSLMGAEVLEVSISFFNLDQLVKDLNW